MCGVASLSGRHLLVFAGLGPLIARPRHGQVHTPVFLNWSKLRVWLCRICFSGLGQPQSQGVMLNTSGIITAVAMPFRPMAKAEKAAVVGLT